jgi:ribosomal protein S8
MNIQVNRFFSIVKIHIVQKKVHCYLLNTKINQKLSNYLWENSLIWGYKKFSKYLKIYLKYYLNKGTIHLIQGYNQVLTLKELKYLVTMNPQSFLLLNTTKGYVSAKTCIKHNIGGNLLIKIN